MFKQKKPDAGNGKPESADDLAGNKLASSAAEKARASLALTKDTKRMVRCKCGHVGYSVCNPVGDA